MRGEFPPFFIVCVYIENRLENNTFHSATLRLSSIHVRCTVLCSSSIHRIYSFINIFRIKFSWSLEQDEAIAKFSKTWKALKLFSTFSTVFVFESFNELDCLKFQMTFQNFTSVSRGKQLRWLELRPNKGNFFRLFLHRIRVQPKFGRNWPVPITLYLNFNSFDIIFVCFVCETRKSPAG